MHSSLTHIPVYQSIDIDDHDSAIIKLPLTRLKEHVNDSIFPLTQDPNKNTRSSIIGMFVLRPASNAWIDTNQSMYDVSDWVYNVDTLDGGGFISSGNTLDAFRLLMHYGLTDAVIVSSYTVCAEGCSKTNSTTGESKSGYIWQPYFVAQWPSIKNITNANSSILHNISLQRYDWHQMGYLSDRKYPAQIIVTFSGMRHVNANNDFLDASIFTNFHPDGQPIEVYIITSQIGATRIKERVNELYRHLINRIDDIVIALPDGIDEEGIDIKAIPELLYRKYNMKIINHDGGLELIKRFANAHTLSQLNVTLCRKESVYDLIESNPSIESSHKEDLLRNFQSKLKYFFSSVKISSNDMNDVSDRMYTKECNTASSCCHSWTVIPSSNESVVSRSIPTHLKPLYVVTNIQQDVAVTTFNTITHRF